MQDSRERWLNAWIVALTVALLVALGGTGLAAWADVGPFSGPPLGCADYEFDSDEWRDEDSRPDQAEAMAECGTLVGLDRAEVMSMLSGVDSFTSKRTDRYRYYFLYADIDTTYFTVAFDGRARVERSYVATH